MQDKIIVKDKLPYYLSCLYIVLVLLIFQETAESIVAIWLRSKTFAHCFLIAPISIWLIWEKRRELAAVPLRSDTGILLLLLGSGFVWLIAGLSNVQVIKQCALVAMLVSGIWSIIGTEAFKIIRFPLLFLFLAVPMGENLVPWLMEKTAWFAVGMIRLTNVPVYQEGLTIYLPSGAWQVIEACSGIRYLIASITLGCLFAYLNYSSWLKKLIFISFSVIVPIVANGVRAFIIVMLGHLTSMGFVAGDRHLLIGWVFYGLVVLILFAVGSIWRDPLPEVDIETRKSHQEPSIFSDKWKRVSLVTILAIAFSGFWPIFKYWGYQQYSNQVTVQVEPKIDLEGAQPIEGENFFWLPEEGSPNVTYNGLYSYRDNEIALYLRTYHTQQQNSELISSQNTLLSKKIRSQQKILSREGVKVLLNKKKMKLNEMIIRGEGDNRVLIWSWYSIGGIYTSSDYIAKLLEAIQRVTFDHRGSSRIIVAMPISNQKKGVIAARETLETFINQVEPGLAKALVQIENTAP